MRYRTVLIVGLMVLGLLVTACGGSGETNGARATSSPTASAGHSNEPAVQELGFVVVGKCTSKSGTLTANGSGFTPNGQYTTEAWYPDGKPYIGIANPGTASSEGTTPGWEWPCAEGEKEGEGDPPGTYKVKVTDNTTGKSVETTFEVGVP
jgi:hypothetical protein